ncbi:MAG: geranylgeranylglyceryl/heptaprenylglyceryl phosphate synthase, partial [Methanobacterium sp.]
VPETMIAGVKKMTDLMVVVGGGIRDGKTAARVAKSGADIIVTGTVVEDCSDIKNKIQELVKGINSI